MPERNQGPSVEIVDIGWQRIQLVLDAHPAADESMDPDGLRLVHDGRGERLPPTNVAVDDGRVRIRVNVMQGPDLQPLSTGRWRFVVGTAGTPMRVTNPVVIHPGLAAAFRLRGGVYRAVPGVGPAGELTIDVDFQQHGGFDRAAGPSRRLRRRTVRALSALHSALLRGLFAMFKVVRRRSGTRVHFRSETTSGLTGNLQVVHDRMVERGLDRRFRLESSFRSEDGSRMSLVDQVRLPWRLAAADIIVIDDFQPTMHRIGIDPAVRIIQLWHASGAFKTVGYSRVGKLGGPDPYARVHKNYSRAIVSSTHDVPFYAEAFGIPEGRVVPTGIPRMDRFFEPEARAAGLRATREAFPATAGRFTILFAPTFRGDGRRDATYDLGRVDYARLHAVCLEKNAVAIIRMHPFVRAPLGIPPAYADRLLDGSSETPDVNDLLFGVDLLITDYSSIVFEFSTLGRPMLFFAYDLDEYIADRDFYEPFEAFVPGRIVRTFDDVIDAIRRDDFEAHKVGPFAARHFAHLDGGSTDRVIDQLIVSR